jgi:small ligand-binding sensory domain FIST
MDASLTAMDRLGKDRAHLALVFTTPDGGRVAEALLHTVRKVTGASVVVGCSGAGVLTGDGEIEARPGVAVLAVHAEECAMTPFCFSEGAEAELIDRVAPTVGSGGLLVLLPDARRLHPAALLGRLNQELPGVPVVGAVAAGAPMFELFQTDKVERSLVGLALGGVPISIGVAQGCQPIGEPYVITRAEGNMMYEIGSRPAVEIFREAVSTIGNPDERIHEGDLFAGLAVDPKKSPLRRGDFLVRGLVSFDQREGTVVVAEPVSVGRTIQFHVRDRESAHVDLEETLAAMAQRLGPRRPQFGLYFNCLGRGLNLFEVLDHDVMMIRKALGDFPLAGFFGNGEFAPIGGKNFFHNYTGVLAVFPET